MGSALQDVLQWPDENCLQDQFLKHYRVSNGESLGNDMRGTSKDLPDIVYSDNGTQNLGSNMRCRSRRGTEKNEFRQICHDFKSQTLLCFVEESASIRL